MVRIDMFSARRFTKGLNKKSLGFIAAPIAVLVAIIGISAAAVAEKTIGFSIQSYTTANTTAQVDSTPTPIVELTPTPTLEPSPTPLPTSIPSPTKIPLPTKVPATPTPIVQAVSGPPASGYSRITVVTSRGNFSASVVSFPSAGVRMITDTASDSDCADSCPTLPLATYVSRNGAFAGINGSYFCPAVYPDCANKKDSFDFPVYNTRLGKWLNKGNLFWNSRSIVYQNGGVMGYRQDSNSFGDSALQAGIINYPGLLNGGHVTVDGGLSAKQTAKGTKAGIGFNSSTTYLVVASNVDMADLAAVFQSLGATSALNLDGGGSIALWYGGYKAGPGRSLPNAVLFAR